jgi:pyridoxine kinase
MNILSIQSHVAYGHVGNAAAVLPLQRLGHEVWPVHTVLFSNHTGYPDWQGPVLAPEQVGAVIDGIEARGAFAHCDAVLSGYVGSVDLGGVIADTVARVRTANPRALFACDPVMGDDGKGLYVGDAIPALFRDRLVPAADIVTPNPFELARLTGRPVATAEDILAAAQAVRALGPKLVLVTSLPMAEPGQAGMLAVAADGAWRVATPWLKLDPQPNGAGDLASALFLAHWLESRDAATALGSTAAGLFAVLEATRAADSRELALVAAQDQIVAPARRFPVEPVG